MRADRSSHPSPIPERLKLLPRAIIFSVLALFSLICNCQTPIGGTVNTYYQVVEVIPGKSCVRLNTTSGLGYNDKVMLLQMKGATISTSNDNTFGNLSSQNNAGNYEINTICTVIGDTAFFVYTILNSYTVSGKVQLVRIPQYYSATVSSPLRPSPWNNATGTGGVVAIIVDEDLMLNAPISADSCGFKGGNFLLCNGQCTSSINGYVYDASFIGIVTGQRGAYKGEGIAEPAAGMTGGRGAPANGGGGGNNHNNSGGGGGNLHAGGFGGGNTSSMGCSQSYPGQGGKPLNSAGGTKIFFGGGGGAGHSNNGTATTVGGGHGGGIVFILAKNLIGNGQKITSSGQPGGNSVGDGAAGGGAGGTIVMAVANYIGSVNLEANGGVGGDSNDGGTLNRCYGGGGGAAGGSFYFSSAAPPINYIDTAGRGGIETGSAGTCGAQVVGLKGENGDTVYHYNYSRSTTLANYCSVLLPVELISFNAGYRDGTTKLSWKIADATQIDHFIIERSGTGNNWTALSTKQISGGTVDYDDTDPAPLTGYNYYRLRIITKNKTWNYSNVVRVTVPRNVKAVAVYPNPASKKIFITGLSNNTSLRLFDLSGKLIWNKMLLTTDPSVGIDLPNIDSGVYFLKVNDVIKKLVIR